MAAFINNEQRANITEVAKEVALHLYAILSFSNTLPKPQFFSAALKPSLFTEDAPLSLMFERLVRETVIAAEQEFKIRFDTTAVKHVLLLKLEDTASVAVGDQPPRKLFVVSLQWKDAFRELWAGVLKWDLRQAFLASEGDKKTDTELERTFSYNMDRLTLEHGVLNGASLFGDSGKYLHLKIHTCMTEILAERKLGHIRRSSIVFGDTFIRAVITVVEDDRGNVLKVV